MLDVVELRDRAKDRVGGYSHGMRQRLGIAASLLREPKLLLLDEPTTGLDPAGMRDMRELVKRLAAEGITILLSSHMLAEVEELCNRVAIIRKGRIIYEGALDELLQSAGGELPPADERARSARARVLLAHGVDGRARRRRRAALPGRRASGRRGLSIALGQAGIGIAALVPQTRDARGALPRHDRGERRRPRRRRDAPYASTSGRS